MKKRPLEVYIHIPFCVKKCAYCDFLSGPAGKAVQEQYVEALVREICTFGSSGMAESYQVVSVFFGGGTPSVLEAKWIGKIMKLLRETYEFCADAEITIECNPGTADLEKLEHYQDYGINRISFGLQSADDQELQLLGRIHTWEEFLETYKDARKAGFTNINVDLMSSLPEQSVASWKETLEKVLALEPEHISAYSLIIEEGTPFYDKYEEDVILREEGEVPKYLPSEEDEREMYTWTKEYLHRAGMERYETSNYAKAGYECRHNIGYWTGTEYVGFGLGASSYLKCSKELCERNADKEQEFIGKSAAVRMQNPDQMEDYLNESFSYWNPPKGQDESKVPLPGYTREILSKEDQMAEFMFLGLRMIRGISEAEFEQHFGAEIDTVYGAVIRKQCKTGLLKREEGRIFLTEKGVDLSNMVMAEFLL